MVDIAVILSLLVALVAAVVPAITSAVSTTAKSKADRTLKETEVFFSAQLKAYSDLLKAIVPEEPLATIESCTDSLRDTLTAIQPALLLSRKETADVIRNFYFAYCDYVQEWIDGARTAQTIERHRDQLWILQDCLRDEMFSFEQSHKERFKRFRYIRRKQSSHGQQ